MSELNNNEPCPHCGRYLNRGVSVDVVIIKDDTVLLVKRGVEPFKGFWAMPGGYVEWDESAEGAAAREVREETGLTVNNIQLVGVYSSPDRHPKQVINILYVAEAEEGALLAADDAEAAKWFLFSELPDDMAFDHRQNIADARRFLRAV